MDEVQNLTKLHSPIYDIEGYYSSNSSSPSQRGKDY